MLKLLNLKTADLNKKLINKILILKDTQWKKGIKSQKIFFKKISKKNDIHVMLFYNGILSGYVFLRKRKCIYKKKILNYFHFDTLIIAKKFRKKKLSYFLMDFTNNIIKSRNIMSVLYCDKKLINFYRKFKWRKINKKQFTSKILNKNNKNILYFK